MIDVKEIGANRLAYECSKLIICDQLDSSSAVADAVIDYLDIGHPDGPVNVPSWMEDYVAGEHKRAVRSTAEAINSELEYCEAHENVPLETVYDRMFRHALGLERELNEFRSIAHLGKEALTAHDRIPKNPDPNSSVQRLDQLFQEQRNAISEFRNSIAALDVKYGDSW